MDRRTAVWKASSIVASSIVFLFLSVWVPTIFATAPKQTAVLVHTEGTTTVQDTPTVDPTLVVLNKEQLAQQIHQLQLQNDRSFSAWFWSSSAPLLAALATLVTAYLAFRQWLVSQATAQKKDLDDRKDERAKEAEQRFQKVVEEVGGEKENARIGGVILLHTFLEPNPDYEKFYSQIFSLVVAYLRLQQQPDSASDKPLDALSQALIGVFVKSLSKTRELTRPTSEDPTRYLKLDARGIYLNHANLRNADLAEVWLTSGSLQGALLQKTNLGGAWLEDVDFTQANLKEADLRNTVLTGANPEKAALLEGAQMNGASGLKEKQIEACKQMGAIFEETVAAPD